MNGREIAALTGGSIIAGNPEQVVTAVTTNSKEVTKGALFVPIVGERVDGHTFIGQAAAAGAAAVLTQEREAAGQTALFPETAVILVDKTLPALQKLAAGYRKRFLTPVLGITGSVGKTTTKEMVAAALEGERCLLKTAGNMNSQVGLPLMLLRMEEKHTLAVLEMGMSEPGEMARLAAMAAPEMMIMTNIGVAHLAQLKTKENIRKEKLNSINAFREGSVLLVNGEDPLLREIKEHPETVDMALETRKALKRAKVLTYGLTEDCDFYAKQIRTTLDGCTAFIVHGTWGGASYETEVTLHVLGMHNVLNALAAMAAAACQGIFAERAAEGLFSYTAPAMRGQIRNENGKIWIDDTYNASPDSMKSGISVLLTLPAKRHIAVLADVLELGEDSALLHKEVGAFLAEEKKDGKGIDLLVTVGKEAHFIAEGAKERQETEAFMRIKECASNEEAIRFLTDILQEGDAILVKGSRGMHTEEILQALK